VINAARLLSLTDSGCVISRKSEEKVMDLAIMHVFEYHAINPEQMTS
jgi:hypothetical protein